MPTSIHRHGDSRVCGATTIVSGQNKVYINKRLVSVEGDTNTDGGGALIASPSTKFYINGKKIIFVGDSAFPDLKCGTEGPPHCNPAAATGSNNVFVGV